MGRLTERDKNGTAMAACCGNECKYNFRCESGGFSECRGMDDIIDRLAAYEDTELEPEEIEHLKLASIGKAIAEITEFNGVAIDRLRELAQADKERRCVVLPCSNWFDIVFGEQEVFLELIRIMTRTQFEK